MYSVEASHVPLGMHIEKVMLVEQALETEEQAAKRRKSNKERVIETCVCTCMVNAATICMYRHGQYCSTICICMVHTQDYQGVSHRFPTHSLHMLTTLVMDLLRHARVGQLGALLSCTTLCSLPSYRMHFLRLLSYVLGLCVNTMALSTSVLFI